MRATTRHTSGSHLSTGKSNVRATRPSLASDDEAREPLSLAMLEGISRTLKTLAVPRVTVTPVAQVTGLPRGGGVGSSHVVRIGLPNPSPPR